MMEFLLKLFPFVQTDWFDLIFSLGVSLNPVFSGLQTFKAWRAPSAEGVAWMSFLGLMFLQVSGAFYAINVQHEAMFIAMFISAIFSAGTMAAALFRKQPNEGER